MLFTFLDWFWFVRDGRRDELYSPGLLPRTFGERYFAFGSLSVREKMFLLNRIVFSIVSLLSSGPLWIVSGRSSGKNFFIKDSMIGRERI
jgi:hypothetical protein